MRPCSHRWHKVPFHPSLHHPSLSFHSTLLSCSLHKNQVDKPLFFLAHCSMPPWFLAWRVPQSTKASENNSLNYLSTTISIYTPNHSLPVYSASNAFPSIAARCSVRRTKYQTAPNASALHATFGFIMRLHLKIPTFVKYVLYSTQPSPPLTPVVFCTSPFRPCYVTLRWHSEVAAKIPSRSVN